jgi:predicted transposase YbfD/YdcC
MASRSLLDHFAQVPDARSSRARRHPLINILFIALCATLCGAEDFVAMERFGNAKKDWLAKFLDLRAGIPAHDTFGRVFAHLDPDAFTRCFLAWVEALRTQVSEQVLALDGKTLRHSFDTASGRGAIHMVSAWAHKNRLVLAQVKVDAKSNEITAIPTLLQMLDLQGCIVTLDAMGCQKTIAAQIIQQGGDYVLGLKDNHPHLATDVAALFAHAKVHRFEARPHDQAKTLQKDHGRIETRHCTVMALAWLHGFFDDVAAEWPGLQSLVRLESTRQIGDKISHDTRYYLSSLAPQAKKHLQVVRAHWGIENRVHWVLDVAFDEDACRVRTEHAPQNLATLRHLTLNLLGQDKKSKVGIKNRRLQAGWDNAYLEKLLIG